MGGGVVASPITGPGGDFDQSELGQCGHAVVETDLLHDLAVEHFQHSGTGEVHLAASCSRKATSKKVVEGVSRMGTTTFPLTNDVIALPWRGSCSEYLSSMFGAAISSMTARLDILAPELREPATNDGLVAIFFAHGMNPHDQFCEDHRNQSMTLSKRLGS